MQSPPMLPIEIGEDSSPALPFCLMCRMAVTGQHLSESSGGPSKISLPNSTTRISNPASRAPLWQKVGTIQIDGFCGNV
jgi:hypothetical protein